MNLKYIEELIILRVGRKDYNHIKIGFIVLVTLMVYGLSSFGIDAYNIVYEHTENTIINYHAHNYNVSIGTKIGGTNEQKLKFLKSLDDKNDFVVLYDFKTDEITITCVKLVCTA